MLKPSFEPHTLDSSGFLYDPMKADNIFGTPLGFNIMGADESSSAMKLGRGNAIPTHDNAAFDRPGKVTGVSNRPAPRAKTYRESQGEVNLLYLGAFVAVVAAALWL